MYCPNCKKEFDSKFCPECGTKIVELICYKNEWKDGAPEISEYCIMMNGKGEWKEADNTMIDLAEKCVYGILEDKTTIFDIIKDARTCGH